MGSTSNMALATAIKVAINSWVYLVCHVRIVGPGVGALGEATRESSLAGGSISRTSGSVAGTGVRASGVGTSC
jgi:hypothetical protein